MYFIMYLLCFNLVLAHFIILISSDECIDNEWCFIEMPLTSYFKFDPPDNQSRWENARLIASQGRSVLLENIAKVFPNPFDFLDGDRSFRKLHHMIDVFVDEIHWLNPLMSTKNRRTLSKGKRKSSDRQRWEMENKVVVPQPDEWKISKRIPIISLGEKILY